MKIYLGTEVSEAQQKGKPIVAIESNPISHGPAWPQNFGLATEIEDLVRSCGAVPATIAVIGGKPKVGLSNKEIEALAQRGQACLKLSAYDLGFAIATGEWGSTTVAGTMEIAAQAGIEVLATGAIGGVHRKSHLLPDISHDIEALANTRMIVVSAGAKAILDLPATLEVLETKGILTVGYQCDEFPAFYYQESGLKLGYRAESPETIVHIYRSMRRGALLIANLVPTEVAIPKSVIDSSIAESLASSLAHGIQGKALTPYLLSEIEAKTKGASTTSNFQVFRNNIRLACSIANTMVKDRLPYPPWQP